MEKLPKLSKDAYKNVSFPLSTFAHGVKKQDFETESQIESELIASIHKDMSKFSAAFSTAYMMTVDSCLNEILCTLPILLNCQGRMSHITKTDNSGYHAVSLDGIVVAEFTITPLYSESSIAFERSIKYSAYADKVKQMASLGDCLDILKTEK